MGVAAPYYRSLRRYASRAETLSFREEKAKHYRSPHLIFWCLLPGCASYRLSAIEAVSNGPEAGLPSGATGGGSHFDSVALDKAIQSKKAPAPVPTMQTNGTLSIDPMENVTPFASDPSFKRKGKPLLLTALYPVGYLRHSGGKQLLTWSYSKGGRNALDRIDKGSVNVWNSQFQTPRHAHNIAVAQ